MADRSMSHGVRSSETQTGDRSRPGSRREDDDGGPPFHEPRGGMQDRTRGRSHERDDDERREENRSPGGRSSNVGGGQRDWGREPSHDAGRERDFASYGAGDDLDEFAGSETYESYDSGRGRRSESRSSTAGRGYGAQGFQEQDEQADFGGRFGQGYSERESTRGGDARGGRATSAGYGNRDERESGRGWSGQGRGWESGGAAQRRTSETFGQSGDYGAPHDQERSGSGTGARSFGSQGRTSGGTLDAGRSQGHRGRGPKGYRRSDERIRDEVCDCFTDHDELDASEIEVTVRNGEVTLSGSVDHRFAKRLAEDLAEKVPGVDEVQNQIRIKRSADSGSSPASTIGSGATGSKAATAETSGSTGTSGTPSLGNEFRPRTSGGETSSGSAGIGKQADPSRHESSGSGSDANAKHEAGARHGESKHAGAK